MNFFSLKVIVFLFFLVALVLLWGTSASFIYSSRINFLNSAQTDNENLANALSAYTELAFGSIANRLKDTGKRFPAEASFTPLDPEITELLGEWALDTIGMSSLNLFSDDGKLIQSGIISEEGNITAPNKIYDFSERSYVLHYSKNWDSSRKNELFIGDPVKSKVTNRWVVPIAYPRASSRDTYPGLAVTAMKIQDFMDFFKTSKLDQDQTVAIAHANGTMMLRLPRFEGIIGKNFSHGVLYTKHIPASPKGSYEAKVVTEGTIRLVSYRRIKELPLVVVVSKLKSKVLEKWQTQTVTIVAFAIFVSGLLGYFSLIVRRQANFLEESEIYLRQEVDIRTQDLHTALADAERANQAKSEFLASMSHELRTPMNAVLGFAQMLQYNPKHPLYPEQVESVEHIIEGGNHLLNLVNGVLDLAKIEADQTTFSVEEVNANKIVAECIELTIPLVESRHILITDKFNPSDSVKLLTDETRFRQVLINLLSNAIKYNKDGGQVTIDGHKTSDEFLHISITDTGVGIAEEHLHGLFLMFHRLGADPFKAKEGTGIGLAVSKLLVERMAGRIGVESEEGVGSTFWIEIPTVSNNEVLIWTDAMQVGVDPIDKDHQVLISLLNKTADHSASNKDLEETVGELINYTRFHFKREEAIMVVCGYPELSQHREMHEHIVGQVNQMVPVLRNTLHPDEARIKIHKFLRDWLFDHIINEDRKIAIYTNGKNEEIQRALENIK